MRRITYTKFKCEFEKTKLFKEVLINSYKFSTKYSASPMLLCVFILRFKIFKAKQLKYKLTIMITMKQKLINNIRK